MYVKEKGPVRTKNWSGKLSFGGITAPARLHGTVAIGGAVVCKKAGATTKRSSSYKVVVSKPLRLWFSGRADVCPYPLNYRMQRNSFRHLSPNSAARRCAAEAAGTSLCQLDVYRVFVAVFRKRRMTAHNPPAPTLCRWYTIMYCIFQGKFSAVTWYLGFGMNGFLSYLPCTKKARVAGTTPTIGPLQPYDGSCPYARASLLHQNAGANTGFRQILHRT